MYGVKRRDGKQASGKREGIVMQCNTIDARSGGGGGGGAAARQKEANGTKHPKRRKEKPPQKKKRRANPLPPRSVLRSTTPDSTDQGSARPERVGYIYYANSLGFLLFNSAVLSVAYARSLARWGGQIEPRRALSLSLSRSRANMRLCMCCVWARPLRPHAKPPPPPGPQYKCWWLVPCPCYRCCCYCCRTRRRLTPPLLSLYLFTNEARISPTPPAPRHCVVFLSLPNLIPLICVHERSSSPKHTHTKTHAPSLQRVEAGASQGQQDTATLLLWDCGCSSPSSRCCRRLT